MLKLVTGDIPPKDPCEDVPAGLRNIADAMEKGEYGKVNFLVWIADGERLVIGTLGETDNAQADTYLLLGQAKSAVEGS